MKAWISLLHALLFIAVPSCAAKKSSELQSSASGSSRTLYAVCNDRAYQAWFYSSSASQEEVNYVEVRKLIGGDAFGQLTSMSCEKNPNQPVAGAENITVGCMDNKVIDGGIYEISIKLNRAGGLLAILEKVTSRDPIRATSARLAEMSCDLQ